MEMGDRNMIGIAAACACCGIIVDVVTLTGLGLKMTLLADTIIKPYHFNGVVKSPIYCVAVIFQTLNIL